MPSQVLRPEAVHLKSYIIALSILLAALKPGFSLIFIIFSSPRVEYIVEKQAGVGIVAQWYQKELGDGSEPVVQSSHVAQRIPRSVRFTSHPLHVVVSLD